MTAIPGPTLRQLQDQLAITQAQSDQNDATHTTSSALETAQYNQRKHVFQDEITKLQAQIANVPQN